ncbi:MAG TPA: PqqD family protein [Candidatus Obscuribacterales bacterium]
MDDNIVKATEEERLQERLSQLAISATGFLFDPQTGQSYTLNRTGVLALECLRRGSSIERAADCLCQEYDVTPEVALSSVEAFVLQLRRYL